MDVDWEAEWDNLRNDDGESRVAEKNLAQKTIREFQKLWDRHSPHSLQYHVCSPTLHSDSIWRYYVNVTNEHL